MRKKVVGKAVEWMEKVSDEQYRLGSGPNK